MSQQEQDALIGQLVRERRDLQAEITAIQFKIAKWEIPLLNAVKSAGKTGIVDLKGLPEDWNEIRDQFTELEAKINTLGGLNSRLKDLGI